MEIGVLKGRRGPILVELVEIKPVSDLPDGAEPTAFGHGAGELLTALPEVIADAVELASSALDQVSPTEWTLEFQIGFKGEASPVPILVKASTEATFSVSVTWRKENG